MFESKYSQYITKSEGRFAYPEEITGASRAFVPGTPSSGCGAPMYRDGDTYYLDDTDSHTMIIGPTGCKKTRTVIFPTVCSMIDAGESAVINDPKGEIYERTAEYARAHGHEVRVLNLRDPSRSDCWNPFSLPAKYYRAGKIQLAVECINDFVEAMVSPSMDCTKDRYWIDTSRGYLLSVVLMLLDSVPAAYLNIANVIQFSYEKNRGRLAGVLENMDPRSIAAYGLHAVLDLCASNTISCIHSSLLAILNPFIQNETLMKMMCDNTVNLETVGTKPTVVYIIYPDEKSSLNFIVNCFFTQCYETLVNLSNDTGCSMPVRVNFILDEFSNLPRINLFENRISEARSRNIRYFLCIQSYSQLEERYKESAETILSNCTNWVCFSSRETKFLNKLSEICGREVDFNGIEHPLISSNAMQYLEKRRESADVLILRHGLRPYIAPLADIDSIDAYAGYKRADRKKISVKNKYKLFTVEEWIAGINTGKFSLPYPLSRS